MTNLWIVGRINPENHREWDFMGVFDSEPVAIAACLNENYFVAPIVLNHYTPDETIEWPGLYYPIKYPMLQGGK